MTLVARLAAFAVLAVVLIPDWAFDGGDNGLARRTRDPALRDSNGKGIVFNILNDGGGGDPRRVQFSRISWMKELKGQTLADGAVMRRLAPAPGNGGDLDIEAELNGGANAINHVLDENDVRRIMRHPRTMIASDGRLSRPGSMPDVTIFDPRIVADRVTFANPHQYPVGLDFVLVNGQLAVDGGLFTRAKAGRVLRWTTDAAAGRD